MIEFRILGSLEVVEEGRPVALGSPKQRALLAVLVIHRGEPVSSERLIDELWGEQPPASAIKNVQGYVSNLRKVLGDGMLLTRGRGYLLGAGAAATDVDRFESLVAEGRRALQDGDARTAGARLREGLAVWRGRALSDFAYETFAQAEIARLEESRLAALEDRIEADLALGEHARLVGELEALVREHPLRERFIAQLMLALYRSGRQADALESYRVARGRLVEELGLKPGRELQALERAILAQDAALEPPSRGSDRARPAIAVRRGPGALLIAAGAVVLLAAIIAVAVKLTGSGVSTVRVGPNSLAAIDVRSDRVTAAVPVGARPGAVTFGAGSLWVANLDDQTISRVDPATLGTVRTIHVAGAPTGIAARADGVWVVESNNPAVHSAMSSVTVVHVEAEFDAVDHSLQIGSVDPEGSGAVTAQGNSVWVAPSTGLLTRVNAATGAVVKKVDPNASPAGIAVGDGAVWLSDTEANNVVRVDPTGLLTPIPVGNTPTAIAVGAGSVWVVDSLDNAIVRIDPGTRSVAATIPVGHSPAGVAFGGGSVWVANSGDDTVTRIDPHTDKVQATIAVGGSPQALTIADGRVWVAVDTQSIPPTTGESGATLRMVASYDVSHMDPALALEGSEQLLYATCAQLVNYPDRAGQAGAQLTPEVAQSLPARSQDGRTYSFTIRHGFRFSPPSNQPVTAQTFKHSIERTLNRRMHSPSAQYLADIVGARAYMAGRASQIAGVIASGDRLTIRLLAPAPDFLSRIAQPAFCAVPSNTPINPSGIRLVPAAGPYYVASYTPKQGVVLARNPNYHGRRPRHFARIVLAVGISAQRAVAEVEAGTADYTQPGSDSGSTTTLAALTARLAARYGPGSTLAAHGRQQYFVNPGLQLDYLYLNTHRPLFSDLRVRQAVNYAIDRRALAQLGDAYEPLPEPPTDHYLPPAMPGFRDTHIYPMTPDVTKARKLAPEADRTAVLYTCDTYPCPEQAQIIKTDLAKIGLQIQIKRIPSSKLFARETTPGEPFDLAWQGWLPDYLDPEAMLNSLLDGSVGPSFNDPRYERKLAAAAQRSGPERYLTYGQLDLDLARNAAPLAAFGNLPVDDLFSARIGCQTFGVYGMDLAALCGKHPKH